jgi:hypothetical protein
MPPLRLTCATPPVMVRLPIRHLMSQRRLLVLAALFVSPVVARAAEPTVPTERPKLAVIISVDQLRGDYLTKFRPYFGEGGFKRLLDGGAEFRDTHYRHSITQTAPGHATILTGVHANVHGVTSNDWTDRVSWEQVNSVEDRDSPLVGINPQPQGGYRGRHAEGALWDRFEGVRGVELGSLGDPARGPERGRRLLGREREDGHVAPLSRKAARLGGSVQCGAPGAAGVWPDLGPDRRSEALRSTAGAGRRGRRI